MEALKKEHTIYGLDIISPVKEGVRFTFSWDYLDKPNEIPDIDAIIHLAGKAHDTKNQSAADRVEGEFLTEECILTPVGPYGESKIAAENYIIVN